MIFKDERRRRGTVLVTPAIQMTAAASGSNGITVADDDDIDFGTGDFFLHWEGSLPDWTPAATSPLIGKNDTSGQAGFIYSIRATFPIGRPTIALRDGLGNTFEYNATAVTAISDGVIAKITCVCVRESASVAGSVTFYVNGVQLGSSVAITAGTPFSISNALSMYVSGSSTTRTASNTISCIVGNFAPTASEVLDLCTNGIPESWKRGSQAATWTSDFGAGVDGFAAISSPATITANVDGISDGSISKDNCLRIDKNATAGITGAAKTSGTLMTDIQKAWAKLSVYVPAGQTYIDGFIITRGPTISAEATIFDGTGLNGQWITIYGSADDTSSAASNNRLYIYALDGSSTTISASASGELLYIAEGSFGVAGATLALLPNSIPTSGATAWDDSSGNTGGGTLPAAGATKVTIRR